MTGRGYGHPRGRRHASFGAPWLAAWTARPDRRWTPGPPSTPTRRAGSVVLSRRTGLTSRLGGDTAVLAQPRRGRRGRTPLARRGTGHRRAATPGKIFLGSLAPWLLGSLAPGSSAPRRPSTVTRAHDLATCRRWSRCGAGRRVDCYSCSRTWRSEALTGVKDGSSSPGLSRARCATNGAEQIRRGALPCRWRRTFHDDPCRVDARRQRRSARTRRRWESLPTCRRSRR